MANMAEHLQVSISSIKFLFSLPQLSEKVRNIKLLFVLLCVFLKIRLVRVKDIVVNFDHSAYCVIDASDLVTIEEKPLIRISSVKFLFPLLRAFLEVPPAQKLLELMILTLSPGVTRRQRSEAMREFTALQKQQRAKNVLRSSSQLVKLWPPLPEWARRELYNQNSIIIRLSYIRRFSQEQLQEIAILSRWEQMTPGLTAMRRHSMQ